MVLRGFRSQNALRGMRLFGMASNFAEPHRLAFLNARELFKEQSAKLKCVQYGQKSHQDTEKGLKEEGKDWGLA